MTEGERPATVMSLRERARRRARRELWLPFERRVVGPLRRLGNARRTYRPVFVTGAMGSGTTLLAFSLGQRFANAALLEEGAIQISPTSFLHVAPSESYASVRAFQESLLPQDDWGVEQGRSEMLALYRSFAWGPSDVVFDKGPNAHLVRVDFLRRCFPEARFVAIFRDPVVNIEGFRRKWRRFGDDPLEQSIEFYADLHERFLRQAEGLGDRVTVLRYEDLVERYEEGLAALATRLCLEPARRTRRLPTRGNVEGPGIRNVQANRIGVVRSGNDRAYERLEPAEIEAIRSALEPLHRRLRAVALRF